MRTTPTPAQRHILENLAAGRHAQHGRNGSGFLAIMASLKYYRWADFTGNDGCRPIAGIRITEAGRAVLSSVTEEPTP